MRRLLPTLTLALLPLAGCMGTDDGTAALADDSFVLQMAGVPSTIGPGATFDVTVTSSESQHMMGRMGSHMSDHMGAHMWVSSQDDPTGALGTSIACSHMSGMVPGQHSARCTAPMQPGTYYMRGHARVNETGTMHHWWSNQQSFIVREETPTGACDPNC